jgi:hypothetical protein
MWRLTIIQKRKSEYSNGMFEEKVEFVGDDIHYITSIVDKFSKLETVSETAYKIERIEKEEGEEQWNSEH